MSPAKDPFRLDTAANHRDAQWLADAIAGKGLTGRVLHLRGLHYALLGVPRLDGKPYTNTDESWTWLSERAAKAARWLGYLPWESIRDQRNAEPEVIPWEPQEEPRPYLMTGLDVQLPPVEELDLHVRSAEWQAWQPYKLVIFGEKSSLAEVLRPLAEEYQADLYLITGEISDTLCHQMAQTGAQDERPMVVLTFADCDPAGHQMAISIGRKLQAFREALYPNLDFEVRRVALTPEHVRQYGLPSTPLKATERRADSWVTAFGVEQTEIDALAALQPELLTEIGRDALDPFFDRTLSDRLKDALDQWEQEAQARFEAQVGPELLARIRDDAQAGLAEIASRVDELSESMHIDVSDVDLPQIVVPQAFIPPRPERDPLVDSSWSFVAQCRALKASKAYTGGDSA